MSASLHRSADAGISLVELCCNPRAGENQFELTRSLDTDGEKHQSTIVADRRVNRPPAQLAFARFPIPDELELTNVSAEEVTHRVEVGADNERNLQVGQNSLSSDLGEVQLEAPTSDPFRDPSTPEELPIVRVRDLFRGKVVRQTQGLESSARNHRRLTASLQVEEDKVLKRTRRMSPRREDAKIIAVGMRTGGDERGDVRVARASAC